jgi:hypothetical protein
MPELPTSARGSGSAGAAWPTPDAAASNDRQDAATYESRRRRLQEKHRNGNGAGLVLAQAARRTWPTATATDAASAGNRNLEGSKAHAGESLTDVVTGGQAARKWATPNAGDDRGASVGLDAALARHAANGVNKQVGLRDQVPRAAWATATANDAKNNGSASQVGKGDGADNLNAQVGGALNPAWVEMLMSWPMGWTQLAPLGGLVWPGKDGIWPAPPGPAYPWEPPRLTERVPGRPGRLRMLGNGQVPATVVLAWRLLSGEG